MILLKMLPGFLVALSFYAFYRRLFAESPGIRLLVVAFFFSLSAVGLAILIELPLKSFWDGAIPLSVEAFLLSSLPEELSKFLFIYLYFRLNHIDHSLSEGIFYGILFGLFFGTVENFFYATTLDFWPMIVRSITALPLHMITGGILGAFVLTYKNSNPTNTPALELVWGFLISYILHGFYNYGVFGSHQQLYLLPPVLFLGFGFLEYEIMISRNTLPREVMEVLGLHWDDYEEIHRFRQHQEWLDVDQEKFHQKQVHLFRSPALPTLLASMVFLTLGGGCLLFLVLQPEMITKTFPGIQFPEYLSIFVFYPFIAAVVTGTSGTLNADYFRLRILRIPMFVSVTIQSADGRAEETSVVFHISRKGFFAPVSDGKKFLDSVRLEFWIAGKTVSNISGVITWRSSEDQEGNGGTLIKFVDIPWQMILYWNYAVFRQRLKNLL